MRMLGRGMLVAGLALTLANCDSCMTVTSDWGEKTQTTIKGELATRIGFGDLDVKCDPVPENPKTGDIFNCTATTADGKTLKFVSKMVENGQVNVNVTNVIVKDKIEPILTVTLRAIKQFLGQDVEISNIDCGNQSILVADDSSFTCMATVPSTGKKHKVKLTTDASGNNFRVQTDAP